jgi:peptidoglycan hydrolase CwlO-like protein
MITYYYKGSAVGLLDALESGLSLYNPETHELVEKKDAKINRLRSEVAELQRLFDFENKVIDERISSLADRKKELDKLKKELEAEENS